MYNRVHGIIIHSTQNLESMKVSNNRQMDKQNVVYTCRGIVLNLKGTGTLEYTTTWMKLANIILSEISQSQYMSPFISVLGMVKIIWTES